MGSDGFDDHDENYWDQDYIDYMNKTGLYGDSGNNNSYRYSGGGSKVGEGCGTVLALIIVFYVGPQHDPTGVGLLQSVENIVLKIVLDKDKDCVMGYLVIYKLVQLD